MIEVTEYDHVGIRVSDRVRAIAFYSELGFVPENAETAQTANAVYIVNKQGVRIHLICNGLPAPNDQNILMDIPEKWPGVTHPAFIVRRL